MARNLERLLAGVLGTVREGVAEPCLGDAEIARLLTGGAGGSVAAHLERCDTCFDALVRARDVLELAETHTARLLVTRDGVRVRVGEHERVAPLPEARPGLRAAPVVADERLGYGRGRPRSLDVRLAGAVIRFEFRPTPEGATVSARVRRAPADRTLRLVLRREGGPVLAAATVRPGEELRAVAPRNEEVTLEAMPD